MIITLEDGSQIQQNVLELREQSKAEQGNYLAQPCSALLNSAQGLIVQEYIRYTVRRYEIQT